MSAAEPIIQEPPTVDQFQYNSDYPSDVAKGGAAGAVTGAAAPAATAMPPWSFPPADPSPCARITTRIYTNTSNQSQVATVQNVLVKTLLPPSSSMGRMNTSMSSSSSSSSLSSNDDDDDDDRMDEDPPAAPPLTDATTTAATTTMTTTTTGAVHVPERAYWMQRTVREAIYGRVLYAIVLKKVPQQQQQSSTTSSFATSTNVEWQVTDEKCAIKEMSWQHIRKERDRLAEDPIKEVSAMQYLQKWYATSAQQQQRGSATMRTNDDDDCSSMFFRPIMDTNVMMPLDLLSDDRHLYSIMPYCNGGELFDRLDLNERFSENEARYWMDQVLNGLETLQRSGICHRDMSLENLLVHENGALIIDMGMCLRIPYHQQQRQQPGLLVDTFDNMNLAAMGTMTAPTTNNNGSPVQKVTAPNPSVYAFNGRVQPRYLITPQGTCGKWIYMSPEIYKNEEPFDGFAVDMWAAGVILFLMLTGFPPWERACMSDDRFKYMTAGYLVQMLTEWNVGLSSDAMDLLQRMLFLDPKDRLSLDQVKAHPWMVNGLRQAPAGPF